MKKKELFTLDLIFKNCENNGNINFRYFVAKNQSIIESDLQILKDQHKPTDKFSEYVEKNNELVRKLAERDDKGDYIVDLDNMIHVAKEHSQEFKEASEILCEEYKDVIKIQDDKNIEFNKFLETELETKITLYKVKLENIPIEAGDLVKYFVEFDLIQE